MPHYDIPPGGMTEHLHGDVRHSGVGVSDSAGPWSKSTLSTHLRGRHDWVMSDDGDTLEDMMEVHRTMHETDEPGDDWFEGAGYSVEEPVPEPEPVPEVPGWTYTASRGGIAWGPAVAAVVPSKPVVYYDAALRVEWEVKPSLVDLDLAVQGEIDRFLLGSSAVSTGRINTTFEWDEDAKRWVAEISLHFSIERRT